MCVLLAAHGFRLPPAVGLNISLLQVLCSLRVKAICEFHFNATVIHIYLASLAHLFRTEREPQDWQEKKQ